MAVSTVEGNGVQRPPDIRRMVRARCSHGSAPRGAQTVCALSDRKGGWAEGSRSPPLEDGGSQIDGDP